MIMGYNKVYCIGWVLLLLCSFCSAGCSRTIYRDVEILRTDTVTIETLQLLRDSSLLLTASRKYDQQRTVDSVRIVQSYIRGIDNAPDTITLKEYHYRTSWQLIYEREDSINSYWQKQLDNVRRDAVSTERVVEKEVIEVPRRRTWIDYMSYLIALISIGYIIYRIRKYVLDKIQ